MTAKIMRHCFSEFDHMSVGDRRRIALRYSAELVVMAGLVPSIHGTDLEPMLIDLASDLRGMTDEMATGRLGTEIIIRAATLMLLMEHLLEGSPSPKTVH